ncbi:uncharacterized protein FIBRA_00347 [Fibroporia radiculosa]|uniref:F-box domain-containing protein n=1 Tax=Fibroporia radiculosa TaxID=599839 RepID=J7RGY6_9APHY|nr:uncharacterized protein FIBRA_00347 [Fibroporia radiculosa]CCL98352.1 predicted protein [Fibroporia radiculosa]
MSTAVHRALTCDDVLDEIFSHLRFEITCDIDQFTYIDAGLSRKALRSAALVNKTLSYHALNNLWWEIPSESIALKVLPVFQAYRIDINYPEEIEVPDRWGNEEESYVSIPCHCYLHSASSQERQLINGEILTQDLDRLRQYTTRVRSVRIVEEAQPDVRLPVIQYISAQLGGSLFPNLVRLEWNAANVLSLTANVGRVLLCMVGSNLRTLLLYPPPCFSERFEAFFYLQLSNIVPVVAVGSQRIQEVELANLSWDEGADKTWDPMCAVQFISAFKHLKTVRAKLHYFNNAVLSVLLSLPYLAILQLFTNTDEDDRNILSRGMQGCFRSLHTLDVQLMHSVTMTLFQTCEWPALRVLHTSFLDLNYGPCLIDAFLEVVAAATSQSLTELDVFGHCDCDIPLAPFFSPLRSMHLLRSIEIVVPLSSTCAGLHDIALNWPSLETFKLKTSSQPNHNSLQILLEVAAACPRLRMVGLDSLGLLPSLHLHLHGLSTHNLQRIETSYLEWIDWPSDDIKYLAAQIEPIFPKLELQKMKCLAQERGSGRRNHWLSFINEMNRIRQTKTLRLPAASDKALASA